MKLAVLGWGSLVWDPRDLPVTSDWSEGGPVLPLEFSRVSADGRLTLVIDPANGTRLGTRFAVSRRTQLEEAICDLRERERTVAPYIGFVDLALGTHRAQADPGAADLMRAWARERGFDAVIWTDLPSNFAQKTGIPFSVEAALNYLGGLPAAAADQARQYIERAPAEIQTEFRRRAELSWASATAAHRAPVLTTADVTDDAWQAIQRAVDTCGTCQSERCLERRLPEHARPWNPSSKRRLLLLSEAPPGPGGFWHLPTDDDPSDGDDLRDQLFRLLRPHGLAAPEGPHELGALRRFMSAGLFLLQSIKWPIAKTSASARRTFNHLPRSDQARLVTHTATAHLQHEFTAIEPRGVLAMGSAALKACRALSERPSEIPSGGVEAVRTAHGLELTFKGRAIPLNVTLLPVDENMRKPARACLIEHDFSVFLARHGWSPQAPWPPPSPDERPGRREA